MGMPRNVFRVAKLTTPGAITGAFTHNARVNPTPNADPARGIRVMINGGPDLVATVMKRIEEAGAKVRADSVLAVEAVLSASPEYFRPDNPEAAGVWDGAKTLAWANAHWAWARKEFGNRIVDACLHMDEATPHIQFIFVPLVEGGQGTKTTRLSAFEVIGRKNLRRMQTESALAVAHLGIRRGIEGSKATHTSLKEYYAEVNGPAPAEPVPVKRRKISVPPRLIFETDRDAWAQTENKKADASLMKEHQRYSTQLRPHLNRSKALDRLVREKNEALATAEAANARAAAAEAAVRKAEEKAEAARIRDIPLNEVLAAYGLEKDENIKWTGEGRDIRVEGTNWWDDGKAQARGRVAITLVQHLRQCDYSEAVAWLKQTFGSDQTVAAMVIDARFKAQAIVTGAAPSAPFRPPAPVAENWLWVKRWLTTVRHLAEELVNWLHGRGWVYADERANAVFLMVDEHGRSVGAEIEGTGSTPFAGMAAGTSRNAGAFTIPPRRGGGGSIVLVESAIDAISYVQLHPDQDVEVRSTGGARSQIPWLDPKRRTVVAFNADPTGDRAAAKLMEALPPAAGQRNRPAVKGWNDMVGGIGRSLHQATEVPKPVQPPAQVRDDPDVDPF